MRDVSKIEIFEESVVTRVTNLSADGGATDLTPPVQSTEGTAVRLWTQAGVVGAAVIGRGPLAAEHALALVSAKAGTRQHTPVAPHALTSPFWNDMPDLPYPHDALDSLEAVLNGLSARGIRSRAHFHDVEQRIAVTVEGGDGDTTRQSETRRRSGLAVDLEVKTSDHRLIRTERNLGASSPARELDWAFLEHELFKFIELSQKLRTARVVDSGEHVVVFEEVPAGVLFHEAIGHLLERRPDGGGCAELRLPLGSVVSDVPLTVSDEATMPYLFGSRAIDDCGVASTEIALVTEGRVSGQLGKGSAPERSATIRRESFRHPPLTRISNTVVASGSGTPDDFCQDMRNGLLVSKVVQGFFEPSTAMLTFAVAEASLIRGGVIDHALLPFVIECDAVALLRSLRGVGVKRSATAAYCDSLGSIVPTGTLTPACYCGPLRVRPVDRTVLSPLATRVGKC